MRPGRPRLGLRSLWLALALAASLLVPAAVAQAALVLSLPAITTPTIATPLIELPAITTPAVTVTVPTPDLSLPVIGTTIGEAAARTPAASGGATDEVAGLLATPRTSQQAPATSTVTVTAPSPTTSSQSPSAPAPAAAEPATTGTLEVRHQRGNRALHHPNGRAHTVVRSAPSRPPAAVTDPAAPAPHRIAVTPRPAVRHARSGDPLTRLGRALALPLPVPDWSKPIIALLALVALFFALRARLSAVRARRLEGQRELLQRDLDVMQAAVVPAVPQTLGGLAVSVAYRPAEGPAAGGDFYDVFALGSERVVMILGDVSGHGHEAVSHAAMTRYTLRAYMQAGMTPRAALGLAGRVLADPAGERFATVAVAVYDEREGSLTYASAGHPAPLVLGADGLEASEACCSPPLGWCVPTGLRQTTLTLPAGARACFFTDGLIEARAVDQLLLGREHLGEILADLGPEPQAAELLERVQADARSTPDDLAACIMVARTTGAGRPVRSEELEADRRLLRGDSVARFLADCRVPAEEAEKLIRRARAFAERSGRALIRVEIGPDGAPGQAGVSASGRASSLAEGRLRRGVPVTDGAPVLGGVA